MEPLSIELSHLPSEHLISDARAESVTPPEVPVPPPDEGLDAWLFLAACFMLEALVWGFPFAYGVFQEYYSHTEEFKDQKNIAVIGTCAMVGTETETAATRFVEEFLPLIHTTGRHLPRCSFGVWYLDHLAPDPAYQQRYWTSRHVLVLGPQFLLADCVALNSHTRRP
jgi:hypothetical protein